MPPNRRREFVLQSPVAPFPSMQARNLPSGDTFISPLTERAVENSPMDLPVSASHIWIAVSRRLIRGSSGDKLFLSKPEKSTLLSADQATALNPSAMPLSFGAEERRNRSTGFAVVQMCIDASSGPIPASFFAFGENAKVVMPLSDPLQAPRYRRVGTSHRWTARSLVAAANTFPSGQSARVVTP